MIRNMVMESSIGQMEGLTEATGLMGSNMEEEYTGEVMGKREKENGLMGKRLDG